MFEKTIQIGEGDILTLVEMEGDVTIAGWDKAEVLIRLKEGTEEDLTVQETETGPAVSARRPCKVQVPTTMPVVVHQALKNLQVGQLVKFDAQQVRGNLQLDDVGNVTVGEAYGNLKANGADSLQLTDTVYGNTTLKGVESAELQQVRGNCHAKGLGHLHATRISGNLYAKEIGDLLTVEQVGGNAMLKGIAGSLTLEKVGGNLVAKDLTAGAKVSKAGGNVTLNGQIGGGCTYYFKAGGNALLRLSEEASAHLTLNAKGMIRSSAALADEERDRGTLRGTLGDGGAEIVVEAGGNILVAGKGAMVSAELQREISQQVEESMRLAEESLRAIDLEAVSQQVSAEMEQAMAQLRIKLESVDWDHLGRRTQRAMERAVERMQRDIERLAGKAARSQAKLERMAQRAAQKQEKLGRMAGGLVEPTGPEPNLEEERLAILKMIEQGNISLEEAEALLDALG